MLVTGRHLGLSMRLNVKLAILFDKLCAFPLCNVKNRAYLILWFPAITLFPSQKFVNGNNTFPPH